MLGVHRSPEHVDISSMRCPDASFAAFVRVFDQDSVGHTARLLYFTGRWRSGAAVDQGIA